MTTMLATILALLAPLGTPGHAADERPNLLWITSEDNGAHLGCYGDDYATTPNLDALADRGFLFLHAWSNAPVCAPARTTIISGIYPTSTGSQHMRSQASLPPGLRMFPELLREAGYYCTNRSKEDYNLTKPGQVWDVSSGKAHWRGRREGQPFFAVWNFTISHESQIRKRPHEAVHDPDLVRVPAYHPDRPEVRRDWAQYYDKVSAMDGQVGKALAQLDEDGLRDSTIIFYYGDHGSGMPRSKRWPYDSGLRVPMIVFFPERFRHLAPKGYETGGRGERLVSFVDLAPTMLSLAGIRPPAYMQGSAFCGPFTGPEPATLHGFRDRMDERYDLVRTVRDRRFVYVRNYMPHRIQGEYLNYMFQTPTTRVWKESYDRGELNAAQSFFWEPKPTEELYDLTADPDEVTNLVDSPEHRATLDRLRAANRAHILAVRDVGFLPEDEMHRRSGERTPYEMGHDPEVYPLERVLAAAELAASREPAGEALTRGLTDPDPALRYWAATGLLVRGADAVKAALDSLRTLLEDPSPTVRVVAAEALALHGEEEDVRAARAALLAAADLNEQGLYVVLPALAAFDALDRIALDDAAALRKLPTRSDSIPKRFSNYVPRLLQHILSELDAFAAQPPEPRELVYKRVGDVELRLTLHAPAGEPPARGWSAVVFFHGGGWNSGTPAQFDDHCRHLAPLGVVGITAEYRLKKKHGTTPFECVADGKSAVRWVREHAAELGIDPARIAAGGGSAGGHVAAAVATVPGLDDEPDAEVSCLPNALVLFNPVFDNGPGGFGHKGMGDRYLEISPLHNLRAGVPPTLVLLGTKDSLVPVETARRYQEQMRAVGGRCELRLYEGQPHGFFNRSKSKEMYRATVAEMDAFLADLGWMED